ncbi:MAG: hypothetical protein ACRDQU_01075 [Pseudonocardiaceae bacterium]
MADQWLLCPTLADGQQAPSNLRNCRRCDTQVWVPLEQTALVDSGTYTPSCAPCHNKKEEHNPDRTTAIAVIVAYQLNAVSVSPGRILRDPATPVR